MTVFIIDSTLYQCISILQALFIAHIYRLYPLHSQVQVGFKYPSSKFQLFGAFVSRLIRVLSEPELLTNLNFDTLGMT